MYVSCISICFFSLYFSEGFVHLESIVGEAIIRLMANPDMTDCDGYLEDITVSMRQFLTLNILWIFSYLSLSIFYHCLLY